MQSGTHYYVLSLGADSAILYEAFRDVLIHVENRGFPVARTGEAAEDPRAYFRAVDASLASHYREQPLALVVIGDPEHQEAFDEESRHGDAILGRIFGDRSGTRLSDLGQIVWPMVKDELSGLLEDARRELDRSVRDGRDLPGLESVASAVAAGTRGRLLVEDGFYVRGSLVGSGAAPISSEVDIRDTNDDAVDAVIDRVLATGDRVVFMPAGALRDHGRVVLLPREGKAP